MCQYEFTYGFFLFLLLLLVSVLLLVHNNSLFIVTFLSINIYLAVTTSINIGYPNNMNMLLMVNKTRKNCVKSKCYFPLKLSSIVLEEMSRFIVFMF